MKYINEYQEGEKFFGIYFCKSKQVLKTKAGKTYYSLLLQDKSGVVDGKIWDLNNAINEFDSMDYIMVDGLVTVFQGSKQINISRVRVAMEGEYDPKEYMPASKYDIEEMYSELTRYMDSVNEVHLRRLLDICFNEEGLSKEFKSHSAAKSVHHAFIGGLLQHTLSVTRMCSFMASNYEILDKDLLITAAILHDIGKIYEIADFPANEYTDPGQLLGHIYIGAEKIGNWTSKIPDFPKVLETELKHCILAHHGELEFGSPKKPAIAEAMALHFADLVDARMETMTEVYEKSDPTMEWLGFNRFVDSNVRQSSGYLAKEEEELKINKNDFLEIEIEDLGNDGEGIGRADGYALFVKDTIPGDFVKVKVIKCKKNYGFAKLVEVIRPSERRVEPACPVAAKCGGCQLQHMDYKAQLEWKQDKVLNCLKRIGDIDFDDRKDIFVDEIIGMESPFFYRNKSQFPVGRDREGRLVCGFYAGRTHVIIPNTKCLIGNKSCEIILNEILNLMEEEGIEPYDERDGSGLIRHILIRDGRSSGEIMVCLVVNGKSLPKVFEKRLIDGLIGLDLGEERIVSICLNVNERRTNVILGEEIVGLYGPTFIEDKIGDVRFQISPLSFYQVNPLQTKKLYDTAMEFADFKGDEMVWDLYCGIGTISLYMASRVRKVIGVEIVSQAIENAKNNAAINGIGNAEFFVGAAEEIVPEMYRESGGKLRGDVVVVDPPRKGCDRVLLDTIASMEAEKIVYISCDPATLARDVKILEEKGYRLKRVRACDMFGNSSHVETVVGLQRIGT